jgi:large subunit ribosomal protein L18
MKTTKKNLARERRHARIRAIIKGTADRPRLVVSRSLQNHFVQLVDDNKGVTIASASDIKEKKGKKGKTDSAKKLGLKIAELAKGKKVTQCVFDGNSYKYHGRIKAIAEGAREGGLKF